MIKQHSILSPSSAARRMQCPGSRELESKYGIKETNKYAEEGTRAHEIAERIILEKEVPKETSKEMIEGARYYYSITKPLMSKNAWGIEQQISIPSIAPESFGTIDFWAYNGEDKTLHVVDYKFGFTPVEAFENWQLLCYALGLRDKLISRQINIIKLHIVQPRVLENKYKTWVLDEPTYKYYFKKLIESEKVSLSINAPLKVSSQCKYCTARHICPALKLVSETPIKSDTFNADAKTVGTELKKLKEIVCALDARISGLEVQAISMVRNGASVPYFHLEPARGRDTWAIPAQDVITMGELMGMNLAKSLEPITPRQALDAGMPEMIIDIYKEKKLGDMRLVMDDENKARKIFGSNK